MLRYLNIVFISLTLVAEAGKRDKVNTTPATQTEIEKLGDSKLAFMEKLEW